MNPDNPTKIDQSRVGGLTIRYTSGYRQFRPLPNGLGPSDRTTVVGYRKDQGTNKMAWVDVLSIALPEPTGGRGAVATEPKITVRESGQIGFNSFLAKLIDEAGAVAVIIKQDSENQKKFAMVAVDSAMMDKVAQLPEAKRPAVYKIAKPSADAKGNNKTQSISTSRFLRLIGYDYKAAGNQNFAVAVEQMKTKTGSTAMYVVELPSTTPARKETTPRKPRAPKTPATTVGSAVADVVATAATTPAPVVAAAAADSGDELFS